MLAKVRKFSRLALNRPPITRRAKACAVAYELRVWVYNPQLIGGKYYEDQCTKFCGGECDQRRRAMDRLFVACLDGARRDDERVDKYDAHRYNPKRMVNLTRRGDLGPLRVELVRRRIFVAPGYDIQHVDQEIEPLPWRRCWVPSDSRSLEVTDESITSFEVIKMKAQMIEQKEFGISRVVDMEFEEAAESTRQALQAEGFGVLSEIRMDEKLKEKLGVDFRRYVILGACNPPLAYKTLQEDINMGLLLPCNVIVYEADDKTSSVVAAVDPIQMMSIVHNPAVHQVATEVHERLHKVLSQIGNKV